MNHRIERAAAGPRPDHDAKDEGAHVRVIGEERFVEILRESAANKELLSFFEVAPLEPARWKKRHCSALLERTRWFETLLDDYHARTNRRFVYFAELNASLRNFAEVAQTLHHVDVRFSAYDVRLAESTDEHLDRLDSFRAALARAIAWAGGAIVKLLLAFREEAIRLGFVVPELKPVGGHVPEETVRERLPHDLDQEDVDEKGGPVAVILNEVLRLAERCQRLEEHLRRAGEAAMKDLVREHLPETQTRNYRAAAHNLQSSYDTWIKPTRQHESVPGLRRLRGHVSLALHLFEVANQLIHFYERHESDEIRAATKARISAIIPPNEVLEQAVRFAVGNAVRVIGACVPIAQELLPRFVHQQLLELEVPEGGILHARPLSLIVGVVRKHGKPVEMIIEGQAQSASTLMGLILFVGKFPRARMLAFRGDRTPLEHLRLLFAARLGDAGLDKLPQELAYLRAH